jgi:flagellar export protein FliJ
MPQVDRLIDIAGRRSEEALLAWQQLRAQCAEAIRKLTLLKEYRERYHDRMRHGLEAGMPATATMAYLEFIGQIDEVVLRQENDLGSIEQACERQWQALVEARREKRTYEALNERLAAREAEAALRRRHAEIDELIQRAAALR